MREMRTLSDALALCRAKGQILPIAEPDMDRISSLIAFSEADIQSGEKLAAGLEKNSLLWNNVYSSYYDALHKLVCALLRLDNIQSLNHLCLFAYVCERYTSLDLDWEFFERVRTKRNGIHYYGQKATNDDWKAISVQMKFVISTLKRELEKNSRRSIL